MSGHPRSPRRQFALTGLALLSLTACAHEPTDTTEQPVSGRTTLVAAVTTASSASPLVGDFDGEGHTDIGIYDPSHARALLDATADGRIDGVTPALGLSTDIPFMGDWNGDTVQTLALYRKGTTQDTVIFAKGNKTGVVSYIRTVAATGVGGGIPLRGDWNGDGKDGFAIYDVSTFTFRFYQDTAGPNFANDSYGNPGDLPVSGDWNNDRSDGYGVYRPPAGDPSDDRKFFLKNVIGGPTSTTTGSVGNGGDLPIAGRWHGRSNWSVGLYRPTTKQFFLYNDLNVSALQTIQWLDPTSVVATSGRQVFYTDTVPHTNSTGVFRTTYSSTQSFLPLGTMYLDRTTTEAGDNIFRQLDSAGFNAAILWTNFDDSSAIALATGTKVQLIPRIENFDATDDGNSKVFGWLVGDEPHDAISKAALDAFYAAYLSQATRPLFHINVCDTSVPQWTAMAAEGDATAVDCYLVRKPANPQVTFEPIADIVTTLRNVVPHDVNHSRPLLFVPQGFEDDTRLMPTPLQYRASVYTAFIHGATGLLVFARDANIARTSGNLGISPAPLTSYPGCTGCATATPAQKDSMVTLWNGVKAVNGELGVLKSTLLSKTDTAQYTVDLLTTPNTPGSSPIRTLLKKLPNGERDLIAVNMINDNLGVVIQLRTNTASATVRFESRTVTMPLSAIRETFTPYAVHVYKF
jgi:hypothetical protein